jgi:glycosyltransferase involved in cell wall biosynthesis
MKVYINNRNYFTWPKAMAEILLNQNHEVIIIDNNSTYEPLLDWYDKEKDVKLIRLDVNGGHESPWKFGIVDRSDYYVVTDPDLDISEVPRDWDKNLKEGLEKYNCGKVGLSLSEKCIPEDNPAWILDDFCSAPDGDHPLRWGEEIKLCERFLNYPVDTTFAIYSPSMPYFIGGIRSNSPYTAKHLPWHIVPFINKNSSSYQIEMNDELYFYFSKASNSSVTKSRLKNILSSYEKFKI